MPADSPAPLPLGPVRRTVREVGLGLITLGVVILLFVAYQLFGTNVTEAHNQAALKRSFDRALAHAAPAAPTTTPPTTVPGAPSTTAPPTTAATTATPAPPPGGALAHLVIPKIGVDKFVVEGTAEADLSRGPGHYLGTPYPGQDGDVAIAGHRTTYGAPFYRLNELTVGDDIYLTDTAGHTWHYQVDQPSMVVSPSDVAVIGPTPDPTLTLTTCNPRFSASTRLIVKAKLLTAAAPSPPTAPPATTTAAPDTPTGATGGNVPANAPLSPPTNLTGGTASAWPGAIGYGLAVVALWVLTRLAINRTRRWTRTGAFAGGVVLCCGPLWLCFENVVRLLPQSI